MDLLERLANMVGTTGAGLRLLLAYYAWLVVPVLVGLLIVTVVLIKALPRQRRRDDLSGQERRIR